MAHLNNVILVDEQLIIIVLQYLLYLHKKKDAPKSQIHDRTQRPNLWPREKFMEVWQCQNDSIFHDVGKEGRDKGHAHNSIDAIHEVSKSNLVISVSIDCIKAANQYFYK